MGFLDGNSEIDIVGVDNLGSMSYREFTFTVQAPSPAKIVLRMKLLALDKKTEMTYAVNITFPPKECHPECPAQGTCNSFTNAEQGECICDPGWEDVGYDYPCGGYCPNNCGVGTCTLEGCNCDVLISGDDKAYRIDGDVCELRVCPKCENDGTCIEVEGICKCEDQVFEENGKSRKLSFYGNRCEKVFCPNSCSNKGICDDSTGECDCEVGFTGDDCSVKAMELLPVGDTFEVGILWGVAKLNERNKTAREFVFDKSFDAFDPDVLLHMLQTCEHAREIPELLVRPDVPCWIEVFAKLVRNLGFSFPPPRHLIADMIRLFFENRQMQKYYAQDVGTSGEKYTGRVKWLRVRMRLNVKEGSPFEMEPHYEKWSAFISDKPRKIPRRAGIVGLKARGIMISEVWTTMDTGLGIIKGTGWGMVLSNGICLGSVLLFTQNVVISLYTMLAIMLIVVTLMGVVFGIFMWPFGAIEAVGVTIFVGMSVDYCLHTSHGYTHSHEVSAKDRVTDAITHLGISIIGGAVTTAGSTVFLFFCHIWLFVQLGIMMFFNTLLALFFTFFFLSTLLMIAGPTGDCGDLYSILVCKCFREGQKKVKPTNGDDDDEETFADDEKPDDETVREIERQLEVAHKQQVAQIEKMKNKASDRLQKRLAERKKKERAKARASATVAPEEADMI